MTAKNTYLMPEYYQKFVCKCGDCRCSCCSGWGIALSVDEYFRIIGSDCSPELRRRLDVAFRPATNPPPTPARYMLISHNWQGKCPLQLEDDLCGLQKECGEDAIPTVCRCYPRCSRVLPIRECCTSTSCEKTLELLFESDEPLQFIEATAVFSEEAFEAHPSATQDPKFYRAIRESAQKILAERSMSLEMRLQKLAETIGTDLPMISDDKIDALIKHLSKNSVALSELLENCADAPCLHRDHPETEIYFEKILANHIFYKAFPFSFEGSTPHDEMTALIATLTITRNITARYTAKNGFTKDNFIDATAKLFRMIEHSRFDETAVSFLKQEKP